MSKVGEYNERLCHRYVNDSYINDPLKNISFVIVLVKYDTLTRNYINYNKR